MTETLDAWPAGETATMDVTYTQANAAGGAVICEISPGQGNEFLVLAATAKNSGTNGAVMFIETAVAGAVIQQYSNVASGAGTQAFLGSNTTAVPGNNAFAPNGILVSGTQAFRIGQTGAGAQNDTFRVAVNIRLKTGQVPSVVHSSSTNPANVSVTAGAESFTTV